jgi:hypothetical protein
MASTVKAYKGMGMEGRTARWYDRTTRKDMPEIKALAVRIATEAPAGAQVLEVARSNWPSVDCRCAQWTSARPLSRSPSAMPRRRV